MMNQLALGILLWTVAVTPNTNSDNLELNICKWLEEAAFAVAQNRDNGIEEYDLIGKYLSEGTSYEEQSVVIHLIDRVYKSDISQDDIAFFEKQRCEIAFVG